MEKGQPDMLDATQISTAAERLHAAQAVVVLTGAGVSQESGVPTFRDALDGLWAQYDPQRLATPQAFRRDPKLVWDWYEHRREMLSVVAPNPGHLAIAELEHIIPQIVVVTQNIDGLHQRAGSTDVIALHGDICRHRCFADCLGTPTYIDITAFAWDRAAGPPPCPHCGAWVRPDVVWFGEMLPPRAFQRAEDLCRDADVVLVVGTSGEVQPAASLPRFARTHGATIIEVNPKPSAITPIADLVLHGTSGEILPQIVGVLRGM
jgi:NAD-dependent deacetylase